MKQQVFNYINTRIRILGINIANTFHLETAFPAENWANIFSTLLYTASYLIFLDVIFGNITSLAGYSHNDMIFYSLIGQLAFYVTYSWSYDNMEQLAESVHQGEMDILLTKPLPTLFYVSTRQFTIIKLIRDAFLPMTMMALMVKWPALNVHMENIPFAIIIFISGQWAVHVMQFLLILPAFWNGQSQALLRLSYTLTNPNIPFEGLVRFWKILLTTVIPIALPTAASVSVLLGKSNPILITIWASGVALFATFIRLYAWKKALGAYNSASS